MGELSLSDAPLAAAACGAEGFTLLSAGGDEEGEAEEDLLEHFLLPEQYGMERLPPQMQQTLAARFVRIALDPNFAVEYRTSAMRRWTLLPCTAVDDLAAFLAKHADLEIKPLALPAAPGSAEAGVEGGLGDLGEDDFEVVEVDDGADAAPTVAAPADAAGAGSSTSNKEPLPEAVIEAVVLGFTLCKDAITSLCMMLSPTLLCSDAAGLSAHACTGLLKRLPTSEVVRVLTAALKGARQEQALAKRERRKGFRKTFLRVTAHKALIRALLSLGGDQAWAVLLKEWAHPSMHRDVRRAMLLEAVRVIGAAGDSEGLCAGAACVSAWQVVMDTVETVAAAPPAQASSGCVAPGEVASTVTPDAARGFGPLIQSALLAAVPKCCMGIDPEGLWAAASSRISPAMTEDLEEVPLSSVAAGRWAREVLPPLLRSQASIELQVLAVRASVRFAIGVEGV